MFVETVNSPRDQWETWNERLRVTEDPPDGLILAVAWDAGDGRVGELHVWESPDKIADVYIERVQHLVAEFGEPEDKPKRHGPPLSFWLRAEGHAPG
jgi:hypothetical protein